MVSQARISVNSQKACRQLYKTIEKTAPKQKKFVEMWQKVSPNKFFPLIHKTILTPKKKGIKKNWHFFSSKIMEYVTYYSFTF
jgi:hypothetical protein